MNIVEHLRELRRRENDCTVAIVTALVECNRTRAHLEHGFDGLWSFLVEGLGYSNAAASRRLRATRCAQKFPVVLELLRSGRVTLSSLEAIAPVLDSLASEQDLIDRIDGKSQAEVQLEVAAEKPKPRRRESVRREFVKPDVEKKQAGGLFSTSPNPPVVEKAPAAVVEERVNLTLSLTPEEFELLERARMLASRKTGKLPSVCETVVELAQFYAKAKAPKTREARGKGSDGKKWRKRAQAGASLEGGKAVQAGKTLQGGSSAQAGKPPQPRDAAQPGQSSRTRTPADTPKRTRHIPRATRDAVFLRDGEQCSFVGIDGRRCTAVHDLQIDHIQPYAHGGTHDPKNLRVLCGAHNRWRAEQEFGPRPLPVRK